MNLTANKANNTSGALGQCDAVNDWDAMAVELNAAVTASTQTLETGVTDQLAIAQAICGCAAETFTENSPGANVANLTPLTGQNGIQMPTSAAAGGASAYSLMTGYIVSFYHGTASTTNSATGFSVQIGQTTGSYLAAQYLVLIGGGAIPIGAVFGWTRIRYNYSGGYWELLQSDGLNKYNQQNPTNYIKNGTFQVSLLNGTSSVTINATNTAPGTWVFDKWRYLISNLGGITLTAQQKTMSTSTADEIACLNEGCQTYFRLTPSGAGTGFATSDYMKWQNYIKHGAVDLCGGRSVTVTFKARCSNAGKLLGVAGEQYYGSGGSPSANTIVQGGYVTLTTTFAKYSVTLTSSSLSGITFGTNFTPSDDALIIDFFDMWGATVGTNYLNYGSPETFRGNYTIDITEVVVTPTYCPLNFMPIPYENEVTDIQVDQYNMGQVYVVGNTYNSFALTISGTNITSTVRGVFRPYQTFDGLWHLVGDFVILSTSVNTVTPIISGVNFKNVVNYYQAVAVSLGSGASVGECNINPGTSTILLTASANQGVWGVHVDVELNQIPAWVWQF